MDFIIIKPMVSHYIANLILWNIFHIDFVFFGTFIVTQSEQFIHAQTLDHVRETSCSLLLVPKLGQVVAIAGVDSLGTI